jgi:alkanesulfonate monooxygenase SsuD/methylene tetrahydromethanopterin reductase-like flavin-dependent oxidoreductase (luciferase family)
MHIGVQLAQLGGQASPEAVTASARSAEALGFDSVWVIDPLLSPIPMQPPHPHVDESSLFAEQRAALDPLATLAFAAAATDRIRLGTNVIAASRYSPTVLARVGDRRRLERRPIDGRARSRWSSTTTTSRAATTTTGSQSRGGARRHRRRVISAISPKLMQHPDRPAAVGLLAEGTDPVARRADGWSPPAYRSSRCAVPSAGAAAPHGRDPDTLSSSCERRHAAERGCRGIRCVFGFDRPIVEDLAATAAIQPRSGARADDRLPLDEALDV